MEEQFAPYELALKLKELGFDEVCLTYYNFDGKIERSDDWAFGVDMERKRDRNQCLAPLWQQAFDWIRVNKNIQSHIFVFNKQWYFNGRNIKNDAGYFDESNSKYPTYEEARFACLEKLIEIVENEKG